jgi:gliding motility-associated-like protein
MFEFWTKPQGNSDLIELEKVSTNAGAVCDNVLSGQRVVVTTITLPLATMSVLESEVCALTSTSVRFTGTPLSVVNYTVDGSALQSIQLDALGNATQATAVLTTQPTTYQLVSGQVTESGLTCKQTYTQQQTIQVKALPVASMSGSATLCAGQTAQVRFTGTPNATVSYLVDNVATTTVLNSAGESVVTSPVLDTTSVYELVDVMHSTASNPVCSQTQIGQVRLEVRPALKASVVTRDTTVCSSTGYPMVVFKAAQVNGYPLNSSKDKYLFTYRIKTDAGVISANYQQATVLGKDQASITIPGNYTGSLWVELLSVSYDKLPLCERVITAEKVRLEVVDTPVLTAQARDTSVCENSDAVLKVTTSTSATDSYQWQVLDAASNQWVAVDELSGKYSGAQSTMLRMPRIGKDLDGTQYRCVIKHQSGSCEVVSRVAKVSVRNVPAAPVVQSKFEYCPNDVAKSLSTVVVGSNLMWYLQKTAGSALSQEPLVSTAQSGTQNYYVAQSINGCEGERALVEVRVKPTPEMIVPIDMNFCANTMTQSVLFSSVPTSTSTIYDWKVSDIALGYPVSSGQGPIPSFLAANTTSNTLYSLVTVKPTLDGCPGVAKSFRLGVKPLQAPQVSIVNATMNTVDISWQQVTGATEYSVFYAYQKADGTPTSYTLVANTTAPTTTLTIPNLRKNEKVLVQVRVKQGDALECYANGEATAYTMDCIAPEFVLTPTTQEVCQGKAVTMDADVNFNGVSGTYQWQKSTNGGVSWSDITSTGTDATEYADATTKSLKIIAANQGMLFRVIVADQATGQCRDTSDQASLSVLELPEAQFRLLSSKLAVCVGDESVKLGFTAAKGTSPYTFDYTTNGASPKKAKTEVSDQLLIATDQPLATTTYALNRVTDARGCYRDYNEALVVEVNPIPEADFALVDNIGCSPLTVSFRDAYAKNGRTVQWTFGDGKAITTSNATTDHIYSSETPADITFKATMTATEKGCSRSYEQKVYLQPNPTADFDVSSYELNSYEPRVETKNKSDRALRYVWSFGDGSLPSQETAPTYTYEGKPGEYNIRLIAISNGKNCSDTAVRKVLIPEELIYYVPNTFTPNGDANNNTFQPVFTSGYDPQDFTFLIFNRWGDLVFESHDAKIGWDGTYSGNFVGNDTYTWKLEFKEKKTEKRHSKIGVANLIR